MRDRYGGLLGYLWVPDSLASPLLFGPFPHREARPRPRSGTAGLVSCTVPRGVALGSPAPQIPRGIPIASESPPQPFVTSRARPCKQNPRSFRHPNARPCGLQGSAVERASLARGPRRAPRRRSCERSSGASSVAALPAPEC
jgi:hypothetical protein